MTEEIIMFNKSDVESLEEAIKRLEQENKELKEEIRFHNKENSNLLAERNAAQIGYDEIREVREHYRSALEEISGLASPHCTQCSQIINIINEVLNDI